MFQSIFGSINQSLKHSHNLIVYEEVQYRILQKKMIYSNKWTMITSAFAFHSNNNNGYNNNMGHGILLLEHINLNIPNHDIVKPFYLDLLGFGLDPRKAQNLMSMNNTCNYGTIWVNAGISQVHLPHGDVPQVIPGSIGLSYSRIGLDALKSRLRMLKKEDLFEYEICDNTGDNCSSDGSRGYVKICDGFGNMFYCRENVCVHSNSNSNVGSDKAEKSSPSELLLQLNQHQPIIKSNDTPNKYDDMFSYEFIEKYGIQTDSTECSGIEYIEFNVPKGAAKYIAEFYQCVLNSIVTVIPSPNGDVAIVGCGPISPEGRASQSIIYRETEEIIPEYDGHHIAIYVNEFEEVFKNCEQSGIVWVNPRFSDKATSLSGAKKWHQFRFKDVLNLETGKGVFKLEHEIRDPFSHEASLFK